MTKIYLVRHGKAAAGFADHKDPSLDELGQAQARQVADNLAATIPNPISLRASPLARAYETAQPLAAKWGCDIAIEPRVAEVPSPSTDLHERATWLSQAMQGSWDDLNPTLQQWRTDLGNCLRALDTDTVVFSHYVAINAAVGIAQNDPRMRIFGPDNCSVTTLENIDGHLQVVSLGVTAETKIN